MQLFLIFLLVLVSGSAKAEAGDHHEGHITHGSSSGYAVTGPAPISIMGNRSHGQGSLMFGLRYKAMGMDGLKDGSNSISQAELFDPTGPYDYRMLPSSMLSQAVVLSAMYAPFEFLTLSAMAPYIFKEMTMVNRMGKESRMSSSGIGDVRLFAMSQLVNRKNIYLQIKLGISFPSGSIDEEDHMPMFGTSKTQLPYLMQIGSGTWDLLPSLLIGGSKDRFAWGIQGGGVIRMTTNKNGYRQGNAYELTSWGTWALTRWLAVSVRLGWKERFQIEGSDIRLPAGAITMTPSANPNYLGQKRFDGSLGFQLLGQESWLAGYRLALEAGMPLWESTSGPALAPSFFVTLGLTRGF